MNCINCQQPLPQSQTGFVVCPHCGAVNAAPDSLPASSPAMTMGSMPPPSAGVVVSAPFSLGAEAFPRARLSMPVVDFFSRRSPLARLALASSCAVVLLLAGSGLFYVGWQRVRSVSMASNSASQGNGSEVATSHAAGTGSPAQPAGGTGGSKGSSGSGSGGGGSKGSSGGSGGSGPAAPTITIGAAKPSFAGPGVTTVSWSTANASSCTASGAWSGSQPLSGSISTGVLYHPASYALTCSGAGGSNTASATAAVSYTPPSPSAKSYGLALSNPQWLTSSQLSQHMGAGNSLDVSWMRVAINWCNIQPSNATSYSWTKFDNVVNAAKADGLYVLGQIGCTPGWANGGQAWNYPPDSAHMSAWGTFCGQVAKHFSALGVHDYEIWNEPNNTGFFMPAPNAVTYVTMLKSAYTAIKQNDSQSVVVTGGLTIAGATDPTPISYFQSMYADGAKGYFDVAGWHPYSQPSLPSASATGWSYMIQGHNTMASNGDGGKPIWATEFGFPSSGASWATESQQNAAVSDAINLWKSYTWTGALFWYDEIDYQDGTSGDPTFPFFGLYRQDWSHKPAWSTFQSMVIPH